MTINVRRCTECGAVQNLTADTVSYDESGLDNVQLFNVPVWVCENGHREVTIPAMNQLHELLAQMIIRKPAPLVGPEIRFLRRRVGFSGKALAVGLGMTAVRLSQIEHSRRPFKKRIDLFFRLAFAAMISHRDSKPFPSDLGHLIEQFEQAWDVGVHRIKHNPNATPEHEWQEAA